MMEEVEEVVVRLERLQWPDKNVEMMNLIIQPKRTKKFFKFQSSSPTNKKKKGKKK